MPSLKDIRSRISSVKNTQQITKAMKMVAASKLRRATQAIDGARSYSAKLKEISDELLESLLKSKATSPEKAAQLLPGLHQLLSSKGIPSEDGSASQDNKQKNLGLIVVAADRGLCGGYNTSVLKNAWRRYQEISAQENVSVHVFTVGRKANEFFKKRGVPCVNFENFWTGRFDVSRADAVTSSITQKFLSGELQEVHIIYTQFVSALTQNVLEKKVLPMALSVEELYKEKPVQDGQISAPFITEPKPAELFAKLLPVQLKMQMYAYLADSLASELGAKMTAMDSATRNASDMISKMSLQANRLRQAAITKELMEIIGGAEALKG
ncbi:MAG: ATP synthase F1 subunit gamma [Bdellovibrionota bacterium]